MQAHLAISSEYSAGNRLGFDLCISTSYRTSSDQLAWV